jgi:DNA-binding MarR family transcriptional regulator
VTTKIPLEAIPEKQKVYVKGQWLSLKDVSSKYGKHLTATPIEILRWLRERGEPVYFSDFIKELNLNKITAYYTLRKLEAKGLIVRIGKRNPLIGLTEKGYYEIESVMFKIKPSMIDIKDLNSLRMEIENVLKMLEIGELDAVNQYFKERATDFKIKTYNLTGAYRLIATGLSEYMFKILAVDEPSKKKSHINQLLQFIDAAKGIIEVAMSLEIDLSTELKLKKIGEFEGKPIYSI